MITIRRAPILLLGILLLLALLFHLQIVRLPARVSSLEDPLVSWRPPISSLPGESPAASLKGDADDDDKFNWARRPLHYPVKSYEPLPAPDPARLAKVQSDFAPEIPAFTAEREGRRDEVKKVFVRCWSAYKKYAWMKDELAPLTGRSRNTFGGWAATLVDTLDLLWMMDLKDEFREAVDAAMTIDFTTTTAAQINVFETTIRYLGGFLAAYDLSGDQRLLDKTIELAEMLYAAFDTPNRLPITRWDFHAAAAGLKQEADPSVLVAEIGSLTLEFTRLAQITRDPRWYDAVARITAVFAEQQHQTNLPGMWPMVVNAQQRDFRTGGLFTLGAMADSAYEYLPKMHALLGGSALYERLYTKSMAAAIEHSLFRPMLPDNADVLISGPVTAEYEVGVGRPPSVSPEGQHLVCFAGGMLALGGRLTGNDTHVALGRKLTDGCIWTYENSALGIMPETFTTAACRSPADKCTWDENVWLQEVEAQHTDADGTVSPLSGPALVAQNRLPRGFTSIGDTRYVLRPEAIESVFILHRTTGDPDLLIHAARMWDAVSRHTRSPLANAALRDVTDPAAPQDDSMESFWTAETLKYFYLIFSPPDLISLDEYVLNTEAHPLRRPV